MERSEYFNYTRPTQTQLNYTEDSKARSIINRIDSACQMGVVEGFRVTVNTTDSTLIDIGAGVGYCGGKYRQTEADGEDAGERISTITTEVTGGSISGQALASYTSGTINYVSLVYTETSDVALAEITYPYAEHDTIVSEGYSVSVLTESQWSALTLANLRERILVAKVTAQGAGTALQAANIQQVVQPKAHPTPAQPSTVTGVTIDSISDETLIGNGTLRFVAASKTLYWTAPGDVEGVGGTITSSGAYTLYSNDTTYWVTLSIVYSGLPASDQSDTIQVQSLYGQTIPRFSAEDTVHRDLVGSGTPTKTNPHGTTQQDIEGGTFDHADLFHKNGISCDADSTQLEPSINAGDDSIDVTNLGGFANSFLVDGTTFQTLNGIPAGTDGRLYFDISPAVDSGDYMIYVDSSGDLQYVKIAEYAPADAADDDVLFTSCIDILDMQNKVSGNGSLRWVSADETLEWKAPGDADYGTEVRLVPALGGLLGYTGIYKIYSQDTDNWIIVQVSSGIIGGDATSTFDVDLNATDQPFDEFLRLGIVTWNLVGDIHYNLRDIRSFRTADTKEELYREHDKDGAHTKPLQNRINVYDGVGPSFYGEAANSVFYGTANTNMAGMFKAQTDTGAYGSAGRNYGVRGTAGSLYGGYFQAASGTGVYGSAKNVGGYFSAIVNEGLVASAGANTGAYIQASETGIRVNATGGDVGIYVSAAVNTGIFASVVADGAVLGTAPNGTHGGSFGANNQALYGSAASSFGVRGTAADLAGYFVANGNAGAANIVGAYGQAANAGAVESAIGVYGYGPGQSATGVFGRAAHASYGTGVYGLAGSGVGGDAAFGVIGEAGSNGVGVQGVAGVIGVIGSATSPNAIGGRFYATALNGTGLQVFASSIFAEISAPMVAHDGAGILATALLVSVPTYGTCAIPLVNTA